MLEFPRASQGEGKGDFYENEQRVGGGEGEGFPFC